LPLTASDQEAGRGYSFNPRSHKAPGCRS